VWAWTARIERAAAAKHFALAATLAAKGDLASARIFEEAAADEQSTGEDPAAHLDRAPDLPYCKTPARTIRDGLRILEDAFEHYVHISERAIEESVLAAAQNLAERALRRLTYIKGSIDSALVEGPPTS
jgi:hypothetical protein